MNLRDYQQDLVGQINAPCNKDKNLLIQADTGSGKTAILSEVARVHSDVICVAHTNILISQMSRYLALFGVDHSIVATKKTERACILEHRKIGKKINTTSRKKYLMSIDSFNARLKRGSLEIDTRKKWLIIIDEAHHVLENNKWGKLKKAFPNARFIGATATPCRLDGKSLSEKDGGLFHEITQSASLKENSLEKLINRGHIAPFKCFSLPEHIDDEGLRTGKSDYTYASLCQETDKVKYQMAADAACYYKKISPGKLALGFCINIEIANETTKYFRANGIPAAAIHSKLSRNESDRIFELFKMKEIKVLFNVDMISEGVDVPAIETVMMLRKTASFGLERQWIGRALRPEKNKAFGLILDFVGNIRTHGLPDRHIAWSLESPPVLGKTNLIPCKSCRFLNLAWEKNCGECGDKLRFSVAETAVNGKEVKYLDLGLIEIHKKEADRKELELQRKWESENVINMENIKMQNKSYMAKTIAKLKEKTLRDLLPELSILECNIFFKRVNNDDFWIKNFKASDISGTCSKKSISVYKKWLKSN